MSRIIQSSEIIQISLQVAKFVNPHKQLKVIRKFPFANAELTKIFKVDKSSRDDENFILHGIGDANDFSIGMQVFTPDGIIWDIIAIDNDKHGLTVTKKRNSISYAAWLSGDWSKFSGNMKLVVVPESPSIVQEINENISEVSAGLSKVTELALIGIAAYAGFKLYNSYKLKND